MGKKKRIDVETLKKLAKKLWTDKMLAAFFEIHQTNLRKRYANEIDACRQIGQANIIDLLWQRSIGYKDSVSGRFVAPSDKILEHMANRFLGPVKKIEDPAEEVPLSRDDKVLALVEHFKQLIKAKNEWD